MPGGGYAAGSGYRYGFNGKEKSDEINGSGVDYDYGARIYDPRVGRFYSIDPLTKKYPELSTYQFASNSPIQGIDIDSLELWELNSIRNKLKVQAETQMVKLNNKGITLPPFHPQATLSATNPTKMAMAREETKRREIMNRIYNSDASMSIQIFNGVGAAANFEYPEFSAAIHGYNSFSEGNVAEGLESVTNVLSLTELRTNVSNVKFESSFKGLGELRDPAITPGTGESELINYSNGLESRKYSSFKNVIQGKEGDASSKYLWTIDDRGINIALEQTKANTERGFITHTNISEKAYSAGEVWFTGDKSVYINPKSARFGGASMTESQYNASIKAWEKLGYKVEAMPYKKP